MAANFTASARIPTRPLSYDNLDLAVPREVIVDYANGLIYIKKDDGTVIDVTASVTTVVQQVVENLKQDPTTVTDVTVDMGDGSSVTIEEGIVKSLTEIDELHQSLGLTRDDSGNVTLAIPADSITTSDDKQFTSATEKESWNNKTETFNLTTVIRSDESNWVANSEDAIPYKQTIQLEGILEIDYPVVDILLSDVYADAKDQLDNFAYVLKIRTFDGYIEVYASQITEVDISIIMKVDR